jgi:hypothetical protein
MHRPPPTCAGRRFQVQEGGIFCLQRVAALVAGTRLVALCDAYGQPQVLGRAWMTCVRSGQGRFVGQSLRNPRHLLQNSGWGPPGVCG